MSNRLASEYPVLGRRLPTIPLGQFPTPVSMQTIRVGTHRRDVAIKHDEFSGTLYGGNKLRKLEYILRRARDRGAKRVATFGTVASHHALATALYAEQTGFGCTCFLSHQALRPGVGKALLVHQQLGTEIVRMPVRRREQVATLREYLHGRRVWVIPMGGSSWLGAVGFVSAGLELAAQVRAKEIERPDRVYVACGTMGTAAGIALGLALARLDTEVQAVRVTDKQYASQRKLDKLVAKTAGLIHRFDPAIPDDLASRSRAVCREGFLGDGYARATEEADAAIATAAEQFGLTLESTYTGKAMAALLEDLAAGYDAPILFWNTYNARPLPLDEAFEPDFDVIPREFQRYFDQRR